MAIHYLSPVDNVPLSNVDIQEETRKNVLLQSVLDYTKRGWPQKVDDTVLQMLYARREGFATDQDCLVWGMRVVVPKVLLERVLDMLYEGHPGISRMKTLARQYVWWPGLDARIEHTVKMCEVCQQVQAAAPTVALQPWPVTTRSFQRVHLDFAVKNYTYFLVWWTAFLNGLKLK